MLSVVPIREQDKGVSGAVIEVTGEALTLAAGSTDPSRQFGRPRSGPLNKRIT